MCLQYNLDVFSRCDHFGGGVMKQRHMQNVHDAFAELINGYVETPELSKYIVTPALEDNAGTLGCLALAREAVLHSYIHISGTLATFVYLS